MVSAGRCVVLATAIGVAGAAAAQDLPLYVGASYGAAFVDGTASTSSRPVLDAEGQIAAVPLGGLPFDDDDGSWSAFVGYQAHRYVALEAGFTDLGSHRSKARFAIFGQPEVQPPQIEMESLYIAARFRYPLTESISATWHLGISETTFDAGGATLVGTAIIGRPVFGVVSPPLVRPDPDFDLVPSPILGPILGTGRVVPFDDPDDEVGFRYGFGFDWRFASRVSAELEYSRHDVKVLELDTVNLRLKFHLAAP